MWPQVFPNLIASLLWGPMGALLSALVLWVYHRLINKQHVAELKAATARLHEASQRIEALIGEVDGRG
jgi:hypothetical protein